MGYITRIHYKGIFIQVTEARIKYPGHNYFSWSSEQPTLDTVRCPGEVYFNFGDTAKEAIDKVKEELC
jgi:hypothetical protein